MLGGEMELFKTPNENQGMTRRKWEKKENY